MSMSRAAAAQVVRKFEQYVREDEFRGASHPEVRDAIHDAYRAARERMIQRLMK